MASRSRKSRAALPKKKRGAAKEKNHGNDTWSPGDDAADAAWKRAFLQLERYHRQHGHCDFPVHEPTLRKLALWAARQRDLRRHGAMRADRQAALDALGFGWEVAAPPRGVTSYLPALWEKRYAEIAAFQREHGHTRVPKMPPGNKVLWTWRHLQRVFRRRGKLSAERIARLDAIGFEWEEPDRFGKSREEKWMNQWERTFQEMEQFRERFGHCRVSVGQGEHALLAKWVQRQRYALRRGELPPNRWARLDAIGFDWEIGKGGSYRELWEQRYAEIAAFQREHGHTRVPKSPPGNKVLWTWRHLQRAFRRKGKLSAERIARLDAIGFEWEEPDRFGKSREEKWMNQWERTFQELEQYRNCFGHCRVSVGQSEYVYLAKWVQRQRTALRRGELRPDRRARLEAIGFEWRVGIASVYKGLWEQRYAEIVAFQREHGHTRVPKRPPGNKVLWHWRIVQREFRRNGKLSAERIARLDAIGFEWEEPGGFGTTREERWKNRWAARFQQLVEFKTRFGHTRVPQRWKENPSLAEWVGGQRRAYRRHELNPERKAQLESLDFTWRLDTAGHLSPQQQGKRRLAELAAFRDRFGHSRVPRSWKENPGLGAWVRDQRLANRRNKMNPKRKAQLDSLSFVWHPVQNSAQQQRGEQRLAELAAFSARFGHSRVPRDWKENPGLGNWVRAQRRAYRRSELSPERETRLESLGFEWHPVQNSAQQQRGERRLAELATFRARFGHSRVPRGWKENPGLGEWVRAQRRAARRGKLPPGRRAQLDRLGFHWGQIG